MEDLEQHILATCTPEILPKIWFRYVDDVFEIVRKDQVDNLTEHFNNAVETGNIKFTVEVESEGKLPMLDVMMERTGEGRLKTTVYRKKTHTDRYLNFQSNHPLNHKAAVVRTLLDRKYNIVSTTCDRKAEEKHIKQALKQNKYPLWLLKKVDKDMKIKNQDKNRKK